MKFFSFAILLITVMFIGYNYSKKQQTLQTDRYSTNKEAQIGGEFTLYNQDGIKITHKDLLGKYTLVFFGFSRCPHICPTQLGFISTLLAEINNRKLQAFFVTIDPLNDDVKTLKAFHEKFDERIQMLTGDEQDIHQIVSNYKVFVSLADNPEKTNHSTIVYIMDKNGKYLEHLNLNTENIDDVTQHLKHLINS